MRNISGEPWAKADLFFLTYALRHGMAVEEVAGFLAKDSDEVRAKARELDEDLISDKGAVALNGKSPVPRARPTCDRRITRGRHATVNFSGPSD